MELGGKSPTIVFDDAQLDRALDGTIFQLYSLNGERCTAGSRLILQESIYDSFIEDLADRVSKIKVGSPSDAATEVGPLIHPNIGRKSTAYGHRPREGAKILVGGKRPEKFPEGII